MLAAAGPALWGLSAPWRAFGAGLIIPGAGLIVAVPPLDHSIAPVTLAGHIAVIVVELGVAAWALRRQRTVVWAMVIAGGALLSAAVPTVPQAVVLAGHLLAFAGVLAASGWAYMFRCIARSDYVTLPAIVLVAAAAAAAIADHHGGAPGPFGWFPWAALTVAVLLTGATVAREQVRHHAGLRVRAEREQFLQQRRGAARTNPIPLRRLGGTPPVSEASADQLALVRHLLGIALQPLDRWDGFDDEGPGPLQQYRYQLNALGWALSMHNYVHAPAVRGPLHTAQSNLFARLQDPTAWGYWYWQNLLGNWDFRRRRADPIDVRQNIMFTGYLNLQLAMFEQATGDHRYRAPGALRFRWPSDRSTAYDRTAINAMVVRNFDSELCLWPCEPLPIGRSRTRGLVFPYCNAVSAAGVAITDALCGTRHAAEIAPRLQYALDTEFTAADGDLVTFLVSGLGLTARAFRGPTTTAGISAFLAPLLPELAWRAWEILRHDWLETGRYLESGSAGAESPTAEDWGSRAPTNAESLAAAMLLAQECGEPDWQAELWRAAVAQLSFTEYENGSGRMSFTTASVHANGMLGLGGLGRPFALADMMSSKRPPEWDSGPRIAELPHPEVLVATAVTDGEGLDAVLRRGQRPGRFALVLDQLQPGRVYAAHGAREGRVRADDRGIARLVVDLHDRTAIEVRPE
ncbi:hypothetical protein GCM10027089_05440 [Nocardia thraciensis]